MPFGRYTCGSNDTLLDGSPWPPRKGDLAEGRTISQNMQLQILCCHLVDTNEEWLHFCQTTSEITLVLVLCHLNSHVCFTYFRLFMDMNHRSVPVNFDSFANNESSQWRIQEICGVCGRICGADPRTCANDANRTWRSRWQVRFDSTTQT